MRDRVRTEGGQTIYGDSKVVALAEYWFLTIQEANLSPSNVQLYRDRPDHQILPALGSDLAVSHGLPDLVAFLSATGMRIGEACALTWDAVSLDKGTIEVRGTVLRLGDEGLNTHIYRKSVATMRDEAGLSARAAADQLGHSGVTTAQDTYFGRRKRATGAAKVIEALG